MKKTTSTTDIEKWQINQNFVFRSTMNQWTNHSNDELINDCISQTRAFILAADEADIKESDKKKMCSILKQWRWDDKIEIPVDENKARKSALVRYLYHALLKFEGHGVR